VDAQTGEGKLMDFFTIRNLTMRFGGLVAVNDYDITLKKEEIVGLIGPNGAGKTTVFNMIAGYYVPTSGTIHFRGTLLNGKKANEITRSGIARTFQNIRLFTELTVVENVMIAYHCRLRSSFFGAAFRLPLYRKEEKMMYEGAMDFLREVDLEDLAREQAGALPYGMQRRLEIARALATGPEILLLDEPAAGMNPNETQDLLQLILHLREKYKITVFLIEHDMKFVMQLCERIQVLDYGTTIASGTPEEIQRNERVIEAYLGEG
jgi:branched-chain amino acid transport system ATP-binding protein